VLSRIAHCYIYVLAFLESLFLLHQFEAAGVDTARSILSLLPYHITGFENCWSWRLALRQEKKGEKRRDAGMGGGGWFCW
jgi:hypothetical protein